MIALPTTILKKENVTHVFLVLHPLSGIPRRQKCLEDPEPAAKGRNAYKVPPGDRFQAKVPAPDPVPGRRQAYLPIRPELRVFLPLSAGQARRICRHCRTVLASKSQVLQVGHGPEVPQILVLGAGKSRVRPEIEGATRGGRRPSCARRFCLGGISQGVPAKVPAGSINYMCARGIG